MSLTSDIMGQLLCPRIMGYFAVTSYQ